MHEYLIQRSSFYLLVLLACSFVSVYQTRTFGLNPGGVLPTGLFVLLLLKNPFWAFLVLLGSYALFYISRILHLSHENLSIVYLGAVLMLFASSLFNPSVPLVIPTLIGLLVFLLIYIRAFPSQQKNLQELIFSIQGDNTQIAICLVLSLIICNFYPLDLLQIGGISLSPILARSFSRYGIFTVSFGFLACVSVGLLMALVISLTPRIFFGETIFALNSDQLFSDYYINFVPELVTSSLFIGLLAQKISNVRAGGFLLAPFAAQLFLEQNGALIILFGIVLCYCFQRYLIEPFTWMIGLSRYLYVLLLASIYSLLICGSYVYFGLSLVIVANAWIIALVIHGVSNDLIVYGPTKSGPWILLNFSMVFILYCLLR